MPPKKKRNRPAGSSYVTKKELNEKLSEKIETKHFDVKAAFRSDYDNWSLPQQLDPVPIGTGNSNRIGDEISLRTLRVRYCIKPDFGFTQWNGFVRVIFFQWHEQGTTPTLANILDEFASGFAAQRSLLQWDNLKAGRFSILMDKVYTVGGYDSTNFANTGDHRYIFNEVVFNIGMLSSRPGTLIDKKRAYLSGGTSVGQGGLYVMFISDSSDVSNGGPSIDYASRLTYSDS